MNAIIAKASVTKTSQIKEMIVMLNSDLSGEATTVIDALLTILESRISEADFIAFCETIA